MDRRTFIFASLLGALAPFGAGLAGKWEATAAAAAPTVRPSARGTSSQVCARCGLAGHTALDQTCPDASRLADAVQTAARRRVSETGRADS